MTKNGTDTMLTRIHCRRRSVVFLLVAVLVALCATACSGTTVTGTSAPIAADLVDAATAVPVEAPTKVPPPTAMAVTADPEVDPAPEPSPTPHPIAVADTELPAAPIGFDSLFDTAPTGAQPVSIEIENINVREAVVIPVGVNAEDLSFEVPPADQVGWYEFGPTPGEAGSAVLAAHIAFNGVDGVFRYLEDVEIGAVVVVGFDDGTSQRYRIEQVTEYVKEALPESLWARDGKEQLALITCGGAFNYQLNSYESNTVAIAVPI